MVVTGPSTDNGIDPLTVRIRNVTSNSFEVQALEWDYLNQIHNAAEDVGYIVMEAGVHTLSDGTVIQADTAIVDENFLGVTYAQPFSSTPVVFGQAMTVNGPNAVATRLFDPTSTDFGIRLQEEEAANQIHVDETVGWIAIEQGVGTDNALNFVAGSTGNSVNDSNFTLNYGTTFSSPPVLIAAMQSYNDTDLAVVRSRSINNGDAVIFLEEEQSLDAETTHGSENVGFLAFDIGTIGLESDGSVGESGVVTGLTHVWQTVNLTRNFANPVVVMGPATINGVDPVSVRVRNVTSNSFEVRIAEWDYLNGLHNAAENVGFVVMEEGTHTLADGTIIEAGNLTLDENWATVNLSGGFASQPVVLSQPVTENGPSAITTRHRNSSTTSFEVRLQEEQGANQIHADETVSWLAVQTASGDDGSFVYESALTGDNVTHLDFTTNFTESFATPPVFLAAVQTFDGADVTWVRSRSVSTGSAVYFLEEEQSVDAEISHTTEEVGFFALSAGLIPGTSSFGRFDSSPADDPTDDPSYDSELVNFVATTDFDLGKRPALIFGGQFDRRNPVDGEVLAQLFGAQEHLEPVTIDQASLDLLDEHVTDIEDFLTSELV